MIQPFQPTRDDGRAQWTAIYEDVLVGAALGETVLDAALSELLGRDWCREGSKTQPMTRAAIELERSHQRTVQRVPKIGYRIVEGGPHVMLGQHQVDRGRRRLHRSVQLFATVNRTVLNHEQARRLDALQMIAERQESELRRLEAKVERQEKLLDEIREGTSTHER